MKHLERHYFENYRFSISYPKDYTDNSDISDDYENLSKVKIIESGDESIDNLNNLNMTQNILNVKSTKNKLRLLVDAIKTQKATLELSEICTRYAVMFKIYNEDLTILEKEIETVIINNKEIGKVKLRISGDKDYSIIEAYLISLDDREITITFITPETSYDRNEKEIKRIIKSIKF